MSTRGLYGIRRGGIDKVTYNHFDSYPDGLGRDVAKFIKESSNHKLNRFFDLIELVDEDSVPTEEQKKYCIEQGWYNGNVNGKTTDSWYCLLRDAQDNFKSYNSCINAGFKILMIDSEDFIKDSSVCEYAYIINLDDGVMEMWMGYQKKPQPGNRYGVEQNEIGYYPCALVFRYPFEDIRATKKMKNICRALNMAAETAT